MSWKLGIAAVLTAAGLVAASPARAGDVFKLALNREATAPTQGLLLHGDADTVAVRGYAYHRAYYRPTYRGYANYRYPYRYYPSVSLSFGYGYGYGYAAPSYYYAPAPIYVAPPVYYYTTPSYYYAPMSLGVQTYSLPAGNVTYSVMRPGATAPEQVMPPVPRDGTFQYDGGPANPVPMPGAEPGPAGAPRQFHIAPPAELRVSLPNATKSTKDSTTGKFVYPAYGEQPRRGDASQDRTVVIKGDKKK